MATFPMTLSDPKHGFQGHCILRSRISQKRCVLRTKLLKNTNRKPYTMYRMVQLSMTLSDLWPRFSFSALNIWEKDSHSYWRRLTAKRVEPVVSISWASCCIDLYCREKYIVGSEQERTRSIICRNWVIDCIMLYTSRSIREKIPKSKIIGLPFILRGQICTRYASALSVSARKHYLQLVQLSVREYTDR